MIYMYFVEVIRHMALKGTNVAEAAGARTVSKDHVLSALDVNIVYDIYLKYYTENEWVERRV